MLSTTFAGQSLAGRRGVAAFAPVTSQCSRRVMVIENAQKKGAGSTKNGRDSQPKRRGVKVFGGQAVKAGGIIVRQVGTKWHAGTNTGLGTDFTVFSTVEGIVIFDKKKERPEIHVFPLEHERAQAAIKATHTTLPPSGVSRRTRRLEAYKGKARPNAAPKAAAAAAQ